MAGTWDSAVRHFTVTAAEEGFREHGAASWRGEGRARRIYMYVLSSTTRLAGEGRMTVHGGEQHCSWKF